MMFWYAIAGASVIALSAVVTLFIVIRRRKRGLNPDRFQNQWRELQKLCADKATWPKAVVDADKLLEDALRTRRFKGKTAGERLTKAQRELTDNEGVWFGHKLRGKIETDPDSKLKEKEVKQALVGIRQALKDLGAFRDGK